MPNSSVREDIKEFRGEFNQFKGKTEKESKKFYKEFGEFKSEMTEFKSDTIKFQIDAEEKFDRLTAAVVDLQNDVAEIKATMMTKQDKNEIMSVLDTLVSFYKKSDQEQAFQSYRIQELTTTSVRHDKEIKELQLRAA